MNGATPLAPAAAARPRMALGLRAASYAVGGLLWVSGMLWLVLHYGFEQASPFGSLPNPWEPRVLHVHGWSAVGGVFLLGWVVGSHALQRLPKVRNRTSGLAITAAAAVLVLTGYALYYTTGAPHDAAGWTHAWLGTIAIALGLAHGRRARAAATGLDNPERA